MQQELKVGMMVRVKDVSKFVSSFAKKVVDRDAVVVWVGPDQHGQFKNQASVVFQKRNGRGKEFRERMYKDDLVIVSGDASCI